MIAPFPAHPITPYPPLIINAALTGIAPTRENSPHVPLSVQEIIEDAVRCVAAGATILHLHARAEDGTATFRGEIYRRIISGIRQREPHVMICVSTSGRVHDEFSQRSEVLFLEGEAKPDMASLTLGSVNFPGGTSVNTPEMIERLALTMKERGIKPELEIFDRGMISTFYHLTKKNLLPTNPYCNLLLGSRHAAPATLSELNHMISYLPSSTVWAATGIGRYQLSMTYTAVLMGGNVRIGLEDNLYYDDKRTQLATNEMLIRRVVQFAKEINRDIATAEYTRSLLLPS